MHGNLLEGKKKLAQFIVVLYILQQAWKPMNYHKSFETIVLIFSNQELPQEALV
jgi:hypothetical protein